MVVSVLMQARKMVCLQDTANHRHKLMAAWGRAALVVLLAVLVEEMAVLAALVLEALGGLAVLVLEALGALAVLVALVLAVLTASELVDTLLAAYTEQRNLPPGLRFDPGASPRTLGHKPQGLAPGT